MSGAARETEIKLAAADASAARRLLRRAGFRARRRRRFEDNVVLDTPGLALRNASCLLRLRECGGKAVLTYKGAPVPGRHKDREEVEVEVSSAETARQIAARLGYAPVFRYQKYRAEYKRPSERGIASLDETPIGVYIELEGPPAWIDRSARRLGYTDADYITASYARLYLEFCERRGLQPADMVW